MEDVFVVFILDVEEKWTFSYKYYSFKYSEVDNIVMIFNNFGKLVKSFNNVLIKC